mmetsp:Transcript_23785/g.34699  ORF Transcript_23785/g.34699 Transcript_23785/m.34699 type:complete len:681 (+) Transcript_23785:318-2360(+)|eukprot:CAMPEP_0195527958 /NCGR_PEP_ID=MMETSP0794_2-20130614/29905_1 /TAXON_ID=515487 /ORGANISM="Stephanopyxis turris, Strain CCMP 815" /LENGTH=680 /DNA_ID=CAMNT_0040658985 /DNA_START=304 /DNA_END=2346 /DNA_ORIENTATION=+
MAKPKDATQMKSKGSSSPTPILPSLPVGHQDGDAVVSKITIKPNEQLPFSFLGSKPLSSRTSSSAQDSASSTSTVALKKTPSVSSVESQGHEGGALPKALFHTVSGVMAPIGLTPRQPHDITHNWLAKEFPAGAPAAETKLQVSRNINLNRPHPTNEALPSFSLAPACNSSALKNYSQIEPQKYYSKETGIYFNEQPMLFHTTDRPRFLNEAKENHHDSELVSSSSRFSRKRSRGSASHYHLSTCEAADISQQMADWSPFVDKVTNFMEREDLPFHYVDVWIPSIEEEHEKREHVKDPAASSTCAAITTSVESKLKLRHVGHATRDDIDSILTLYHMNEFGSYSSKFSFEPGVGLPGRVFKSCVPTWDDAVQNLSMQQFPRMSGAKTHGVMEALGIPIFSSTLGTIIIAMYSTEDISKDLDLIQKCCSEFHKYTPQAKWVLDIEMNFKQDQVVGTEERCMFRVLEQHSSRLGDQRVSYLMSLLCKVATTRTNEENEWLANLELSYLSYLQTKKEKSDLADLLVNDWIFLSRGKLPKAASHRNLEYSGIRSASTNTYTPTTNTYYHAPVSFPPASSTLRGDASEYPVEPFKRVHENKKQTEPAFAVPESLPVTTPISTRMRVESRDYSKIAISKTMSNTTKNDFDQYPTKAHTGKEVVAQMYPEVFGALALPPQPQLSFFK